MRLQQHFILGTIPEKVTESQRLEGWVGVEPKPILILCAGWEDDTKTLGVQPCELLTGCVREGIRVFHVC